MELEGDSPPGAWAIPLVGSSILAIDVHDRTAQESDSTKGWRYNPDPNWDAAGCSSYIPQLPNLDSDCIADVVLGCPDQPLALQQGMPCTQGNVGYTSAAPRSQHTGGVNAVALDSHVGFISDDIDVLCSYR